MPAALLFVIFVVLLVIAIPVSITLGIASVLPSVFDPSFTVGAKYLIRAMFGGLDSFPLPLLRRYLRLCPGNRRSRRKHDDPDFKRPRL